MILRLGILLVCGVLAATEAGLGVARLPEPPPAWNAALRGSGVPFANPSSDAALVWGLQASGVDLAKWQGGAEQHEVWLSAARAQLAQQVRLEAVRVQGAAQALPDEGVDRQRLLAVRDDLRYLVEAYGPNVPTATVKLQSLYESAQRAAQKGEAAILKKTAVSIADSLLQGLPKESDGVLGESLPAGARSAKEIALSAPAKKYSFDERAKLIRQAVLYKVATGPRSKSTLDLRRQTIDGIQAEMLDDNGRSNAGIYRYVRDGRRRIMKVTTQEESEAYPAEGPEYNIDLQVRGGALGALFGAPRLLRTGVADLGYHRHYFIEMEEMFPGEDPRSFKDAAASRDVRFMAALAKPRADGRTGCAEIADKIVEVLEYGVAPYDGDFLVTADGRLSWIDTNLWVADESPAFPREKVKALREAYYFLNRFSLDRDAGRAFAREFVKGLRQSKRLADSFKEDILRDWIENDPELLKKLGLPTELSALASL